MPTRDRRWRQPAYCGRFSDAVVARAAKRLDKRRFGQTTSADLVRAIAPLLLAGLYDPACQEANGVLSRRATLGDIEVEQCPDRVD